jgi:UDP-glucose 4-epimerase
VASRQVVQHNYFFSPREQIFNRDAPDVPTMYPAPPVTRIAMDPPCFVYLVIDCIVQTGITLLGSLLQAGVRRFVFSCAIYGEPESLRIKEDSRQWPTSLYGWSKLLLERLLASYDTAYDLKFVALRYFNAAGATQIRGEDHERETHLIANILQVVSGKRNKLSVFGNTYPTPDCTTVRDYIHVMDLAQAHARALEYLRRGGRSESVNLGSSCGHSVLEVLECARQVTGRPILTQIEPVRSGDSSRLIADATKAQSILGWIPGQLDLPTVLRSAREWHLQHPQGYTPK